MSIIKAKNIRKNFDDLQVLKGIDLSIEDGELVSIVGASGAGKSTLLHILATLLPAEKGASIEIAGIEISNLKDKDLSKIRNEKIGIVFQSNGLLPEFTALENVMLPALIKGINKKEAEQKAKELLDMLGLEKLYNQQASKMSGGEAQRTAIARALINGAKVVLADEPTGSLDTKNREAIHNIFFELRDKLGQTFVIVTHDNDFAARCDRMISLKDGQIESISTKKH